MTTKTIALPKTDCILSAQNLSKSFYTKTLFKKQAHPILSDISFSVERGTTYGLVGESGSGKSTIANCIIGILNPNAGRILFNGEDLTAKRNSKGSGRMFHENRIQMVFQDPFSSLDPSMNIYDILDESLMIQSPLRKEERKIKIHQITSEVGISIKELQKKPSEFSGGQCQRIAIARALIVEPEFVILDEAVSALDVSIQSQVLNLLIDLQTQKKLSYLFISHDLSVVNHISDQIGVIHNGQIVEELSHLDEYTHEYTGTLIKYKSAKVRTDYKF